MNRELQLDMALRDLIATIDLFTDITDNRVEREPLDKYIERAKKLLNCMWEPDALAVEKAGVLVPWDQACPWIDASQQRPDSDTTVLVSLKDAIEPVWLGFHDGIGWRDVDGQRINVTAWIDLPQAFDPAAAAVRLPEIS